jgi:ABC-type uncharacterized transport system substrate-binding protein
MIIQRVMGIIFVALSMVALVPPVEAADTAEFSTRPVTNGGKKWRIGYYEGGDYLQYQMTLMATVRGLMTLGWIEPATIPSQEGAQTGKLWAWLADNLASDYLEFVKDAHYSASWNEGTRMRTAAALMKRLNTEKDIDLLIAMGTWAGKDLANDRHSTPTMVLSTSDPIAAGIITSVEDSGFDNVHARVDPRRYERQVKIFHEMIGFKRLGVAFEDSVNGRSYAAIDVVERLSKERGFQVLRCYTKSDIPDISVAEKSVIDCFEQLVNKVDAIYITEQGGVTRESIPKLVNIAIRHSIPTFSQAGAEQVRFGVLTSLSQAGFRYVGDFHAKTFAMVFNGAKPNQLDQLFEEPPKIALNLKTAELIGFDPPLVLLGAADEVFDEIAVPK